MAQRPSSSSSVYRSFVSLLYYIDKIRFLIWLFSVIIVLTLQFTHRMVGISDAYVECIPSFFHWSVDAQNV